MNEVFQSWKKERRLKKKTELLLHLITERNRINDEIMGILTFEEDETDQTHHENQQ